MRTFRYLENPRLAGLFLLIVATATGCGSEESPATDSSVPVVARADAGPDIGDDLDAEASLDSMTDSRPARTILDGCDVTHLSAGARAGRYSCTRYGDRPEIWECSCDRAAGEAPTSFSCEDALAEVCGVSSVQNYCSESRVGACWLESEDDTHQCACGVNVSSARGSEECHGELFAACAEPCEIPEQGSCSPNGETGLYDCVCNDGRESSIEGAHCERALGTTCEAICRTSDGVCYGGEDQRSLDCRCSGDEEFVNTAEFGYGEEEACSAIRGLCGTTAVDETCRATSEDGTATGECTVRASGDWNCSCATAQGENSGVGGGSDGTSCDERLRAFCPQAFE